MNKVLQDGVLLSLGSTKEYGKMFREFRGHDPKIEQMLKNRGLLK